MRRESELTRHAFALDRSARLFCGDHAAATTFAFAALFLGDPVLCAFARL